MMSLIGYNYVAPTNVLIPTKYALVRIYFDLKSLAPIVYRIVMIYFRTFLSPLRNLRANTNGPCSHKTDRWTDT